MPSIVVTRATGEIMNRARPFNIIIDGVKVDNVRYGEVKQIPVTSGTHTIKSTVDWCSSPTLTFTVTDSEVKNFEVASFKYSTAIWIIAIIAIVANLILRRLYHVDWAFWLVLPSAIIFLYYLTLGRKNYIRLYQKESDNYTPSAKI